MRDVLPNILHPDKFAGPLSMAASVILLTSSLVSGGYVTFLYLRSDAGQAFFIEKLLASGVVFLFGLGVAAAGVHVLKMWPISWFTTAFAWLCIFAAALVYTYVIVRLHDGSEYTLPRFLKHGTALTATLLACITLHQIKPYHALRYFAAPIFILTVAHAQVILVYFVAWTPQAHPDGFLVTPIHYDISCLLSMVLISGLMFGGSAIAKLIKTYAQYRAAAQS